MARVDSRLRAKKKIGGSCRVLPQISADGLILVVKKCTIRNSGVSDRPKSRRAVTGRVRAVVTTRYGDAVVGRSEKQTCGRDLR